MGKKLSMLGLPASTIRTLYAKGFETVADIAAYSPEELAKGTAFTSTPIIEVLTVKLRNKLVFACCSGHCLSVSGTAAFNDDAVCGSDGSRRWQEEHYLLSSS